MANGTKPEKPLVHHQSNNNNNQWKKKKKAADAGADLLQKSAIILRDIDHAPILQNQPLQKFPAFRLNDITLGQMLGKGTVGTVNEITAIQPGFGSCGNHPLPGKANDIHVGNDEHHREAMISRTLRNGRCRYAMKYLRSDLKKSPTNKQSVRARLDLAIEVKYLEAMNHPCIIKLRAIPSDCDVMDPNYFFLMDRLEDTLEDRMQLWKGEVKATKGGFLGLRQDKDAQKEHLQERLTVACDVASACKYMHSHQLLHRDVKPENIGFDIRGNVKLFDLGLAKSLLPKDHACGGLYNLTPCTGSLPYMAPEVAKKNPYNEKCDVFSFGILLWEIVSLKEAFPQYQSRKELYEKVAEIGIRPSINQSWPSEVKKILPQCWHSSFKLRPSMEDAHKSLEDSIQGIDKSRTKMLGELSGRSLTMASSPLASKKKTNGRSSKHMAIFGSRSGEVSV